MLSPKRAAFPRFRSWKTWRCRARLKALSPPLCVRSRAVTSGRRWERDGVLRTIFLMWKLRFAYAMGVAPERLARRYGVERTSS
jgi:hypothetical protein